MKFRILLHRKANEFLKELGLKDKQRIIDKLKQLEDFPKIRLDIVKVVAKIDVRKRVYR